MATPSGRGWRDEESAKLRPVRRYRRVHRHGWGPGHHLAPDRVGLPRLPAGVQALGWLPRSSHSRLARPARRDRPGDALRPVPRGEPMTDALPRPGSRAARMALPRSVEVLREI